MGDTGQLRAIVIGAGSAGLACAALLQKEGLEVDVLDRAGAVGDAWRNRYEGLRLNSVRSLSGMPGLPMPRAWGRWVSGDLYHSYLQRYAHHHRLTVRLGVLVRAVIPDGDGWLVQTSTGVSHAAVVVVAIGHEGRPSWPAWPGQHEFSGRLIHSAQYRQPRMFAGQDVLVVGAGNSGTEIALALTGVAARVRLSVRTAPALVPVELVGMPIQVIALLLGWLPWQALNWISLALHRLCYRDLARHGLPAPRVGAYERFRRHRVTPVFDRGFAAAVRSGAIEVVPGVSGLEPDAVVLADGARVRPETVIAATGYERAFAGLVDIPGVLDAVGRPVVWGGVLPGAPGLFIVGAPSMKGHLWQHANDARRVRRAVRRIVRARISEGRPTREGSSTHQVRPAGRGSDIRVGEADDHR